MITASSLTNGTVTLIIDGGAKILTARKDHPKWNDIVEAFKTQNESLLESLISLKAVVETYSVGELSINSTGVTYRGQPMHTVDSDRVMAFLRDGLPYKPIANYISRKLLNPSARAIAELYNFLENQNMPITPEGKIVAYKGVRNDFFSVTGNKSTVVLQGEVNEQGQILNTVGTTIEVERSSVDDDFRNGCSFGLHAGSLKYATGFGSRTILVSIDPADVVSVPSESGCQKLRCCKYEVIGEYTGPMPDNFTDEFSDHEQCTCGEHSCEHCGSDVAEAESEQPVKTNSKNDIANRLKAIFVEQLGISESDLNGATELSETGADSLDAVELVMAFEEEFKLPEIPEDVAESYANKTFSELVDYIYEQVNPTSNGAQPTSLSDAYAVGTCDGLSDAAKGKSPKYLDGDQSGADSDIHAQYIAGYLHGFKN